MRVQGHKEVGLSSSREMLCWMGLKREGRPLAFSLWVVGGGGIPHGLFWEAKFVVTYWHLQPGMWLWEGRAGIQKRDNWLAGWHGAGSLVGLDLVLPWSCQTIEIVLFAGVESADVGGSSQRTPAPPNAPADPRHVCSAFWTWRWQALPQL